MNTIGIRESKNENSLFEKKIPFCRSVHSIAEDGEAGTHGGEKALVFILLGATHIV